MSKNNKFSPEEIAERLKPYMHGTELRFIDQFERKTFYVDTTILEIIDDMAKGKPRGEKTRIINEALLDYIKKKIGAK